LTSANAWDKRNKKEGIVSQTAGKEQHGWSIGGLLDWTASYLVKKGSKFPRLDAEVLLAHALECRRIELYTRYEEPAPEEVRARFRELVQRRVEGCPVAYLVGRKEFFSLQLEVSPAVLIPRPESEFVVLECLRLAKDIAAPRILDVGTGSGNLSIAVAHQHKNAQVTTVDSSGEALAVAARNAAKHEVAERIRFLQGDLFAPLSPGEIFDFVLCNPPYIAHEDMPSLAPGVRNYEPHLALDGGPGGYVVFDRVIGQARNYLVPGGQLIVEIGAPQHEEARARISAYPEYELAETIYDGSRHPRVLRARRK
jgi:release factor glutamine methyltransferase